MKPVDRIALVILQGKSVHERLVSFDYFKTGLEKIGYDIPKEDARASVIRDCKTMRNELLHIIKDLEATKE